LLDKRLRENGANPRIEQSRTITPQKVGPINPPMRDFVASALSQSWAKGNPQAEKRFSIALDDISYESTSGGSISCADPLLERDFPQNLIYFEGNVFQVSMLPVSISFIAIIPNLVVHAFESKSSQLYLSPSNPSRSGVYLDLNQSHIIRRYDQYSSGVFFLVVLVAHCISIRILIDAGSNWAMCTF
jgi:hypothetical protein